MSQGAEAGPLQTALSDSNTKLTPNWCPKWTPRGSQVSAGQTSSAEPFGLYPEHTQIYRPIFFNYPLTGETMFWSTIPSYTEAGMSKLSGMLAVFPLPNRFTRLMVSASGWPLLRSIHCIAAVRVQV